MVSGYEHLAAVGNPAKRAGRYCDLSAEYQHVDVRGKHEFCHGSQKKSKEKNNTMHLEVNGSVIQRTPEVTILGVIIQEDGRATKLMTP